MRSLLVMSIALVMVQAEAQETAAAAACKPNYQVSHEACKPTGRTAGYITTTETVRVATGACQPDDMVLCKEHPTTGLIAKYPNVQTQDIRLSRAYHKDTVGKLCGPISDLRAKVDVYCDYDLQVPRPELGVDDSCPVSGVNETNSCYSRGKTDISVDMETIIGCLNAKPSTESELWTKAACLVDAFKAQTNGRLKTDLSSATYDRMEVQLKAMQKRSGMPAALSQYIEVELKSGSL